jgi:hypothetical protein
LSRSKFNNTVYLLECLLEYSTAVQVLPVVDAEAAEPYRTAYLPAWAHITHRVYSITRIPQYSLECALGANEADRVSA